MAIDKLHVEQRQCSHDPYLDVFGDREPSRDGVDWFKVATYLVLAALVASFWTYVMVLAVEGMR